MEEREKWGRPGNTYHVNDVWWMQGGRKVDIGGRGPRANNVLDFIIERSNDSQDSWGSQDWQYSTSPVRISLYRLLHTSWLMGKAPPTSTSRPPNIIHVIGVPRSSPFFALFHFHVWYWTKTEELKPKNKKRGRPGTLATPPLNSVFSHFVAHGQPVADSGGVRGQPSQK